METLKTELNQGGFTLRQVERKGEFAIYAQLKGGATISYEVIRVQTKPAETIFSKTYPEREVYPSNEAWGQDAWTCTTLSRAKERLAGLATS